jgi:hypothetical protein
MKKKRIDAIWVKLSLVFIFVTCLFQNRGQADTVRSVEIKYFALNPSEYVGKTVELSGQIRSFGPGESWFLFEDATGKVLVTATRLSEPLQCGLGSYARIQGKLTFLGDEFGLYFSMNRLISCDLRNSWLQASFGRLLQDISLFLSNNSKD